MITEAVLLPKMKFPCPICGSKNTQYVSIDKITMEEDLDPDTQYYGTVKYICMDCVSKGRGIITTTITQSM